MVLQGDPSTERPQEGLRRLNTLRVLVADDHRLMLAAVRRAFSDVEDFEIVAEVSVGSQVVSAVRGTKPDVVLLDMRMPELDGLTCLERLRKHDPSIAVVILSSYSDEAQIEAAREGGALGYVVKTVEPVDLADSRAEGALGSSRSRSGGRRSWKASPPTAGDDPPQRARRSGSRGSRTRAVESRDRPPALDQRADRQVPPAQHLPEARHLEPNRSGSVCLQHGHRRRRSKSNRREPVHRAGANAGPSGEAERGLAAANERLLVRLGFDLHDGPLQQVYALAQDVRLLREQLLGLVGSEHREPRHGPLRRPRVAARRAPSGTARPGPLARTALAASSSRFRRQSAGSSRP